MKAEIVAVGTELLLGQISNENARWMSEHLAEIGVDVLRSEVVGDNVERIVGVLSLAAERSDVVVVTGGLGPTGDDLTRDAIAEFLHAPMVFHPELETLLLEKFASFGHGEMPGNNLRQAEVPKGCRYITPIRGTAPGLACELSTGVRVYAVPGVPVEMVEMMEGAVLPELAAMSDAGAIVSRTIRCTGIGESRVAEILDDFFRTLKNPTVAYLATSGEVSVRLTAKAGTAAETKRIIAPVADAVASRLGDFVFTTEGESLEDVVLRLLGERGLTLSCAESITGGGVGARLTSVPRASAAFMGSAVVYSQESKRDVLGVSPQTLGGPGPVSRECALEMAEGTRRLYRAGLGLSLTGAAGPEPHGGTGPGTVWIALAADDVHHARGFVVEGERERVRRGAEQAGLDLVRRYLEGRELPLSDRVI